MTTYAWEQIEHPSGYGEEFEVDGEVVGGTVRHADPQSTRFIALVRKSRATRETVEVVSEGVEEEDDASSQSEEVPYYCEAETASGHCTREVDGPDETCWQH